MASSSSSAMNKNTLTTQSRPLKSLLELCAEKLKECDSEWKAFDEELTRMAVKRIEELQSAIRGSRDSIACSSSASSSSQNQSVTSLVARFDEKHAERYILGRLGLAQRASLQEHMFWTELRDFTLNPRALKAFSHPAVHSYFAKMKSDDSPLRCEPQHIDVKSSALNFRLRHGLGNTRAAIINHRIQAELEACQGSILLLPREVLNLLFTERHLVKVLDLTPLRNNRDTIASVFSGLEDLRVNTGVRLASEGHKRGKPCYEHAFTKADVPFLERCRKLRVMRLVAWPEDSRVPKEMREDAIVSLASGAILRKRLEGLELEKFLLTPESAKELTRFTNLKHLNLDCLRPQEGVRLQDVLEAMGAIFKEGSAWTKLESLVIRDVQGTAGALTAAEIEAFEDWIRKLIRQNPGLKELRLPLRRELLSRDLLDTIGWYCKNLRIVDLFRRDSVLRHGEECAYALKRLLENNPVRWLSIGEHGLQSDIRHAAPDLIYLKSKRSIGFGRLGGKGANFQSLEMLMPVTVPVDARMRFLSLNLPRINAGQSSARPLANLQSLVTQMSQLRRGPEYAGFWGIWDEFGQELVAAWKAMPGVQGSFIDQFTKPLLQQASREAQAERQRQIGSELRRIKLFRSYKELEKKKDRLNRNLVECIGSATETRKAIEEVEEKLQLMRSDLGPIAEVTRLEERFVNKYGKRLDSWLEALNYPAQQPSDAATAQGFQIVQAFLIALSQIRLRELSKAASVHGMAFRKWVLADPKISKSEVEGLFMELQRLEKLGQRAKAEDINGLISHLVDLLDIRQRSELERRYQQLDPTQKKAMSSAGKDKELDQLCRRMSEALNAFEKEYDRIHQDPSLTTLEESKSLEKMVEGLEKLMAQYEQRVSSHFSSSSSSSSSSHDLHKHLWDHQGFAYDDFFRTLMLPGREKMLGEQLERMGSRCRELKLLSLRMNRNGGRPWLGMEAWGTMQKLAMATPELEFLQLGDGVASARVPELVALWPHLKEIHITTESASQELRQVLSDRFPELYVQQGKLDGDPFDLYRRQMARMDALSD